MIKYPLTILFITGMLYGSDDPYATLRVDNEIPLLTQEIIKFYLKAHGIQFFDKKQKEAEEKATAYNKRQEEIRDYDGEYGFAAAVPSWKLTTIFYDANKESDPLTCMVYKAFNKNNEKQDQRTAHRTRLTLQPDGSIESCIPMQGYPYMWAKEYSKKNPI